MRLTRLICAGQRRFRNTRRKRPPLLNVEQFERRQLLNFTVFNTGDDGGGSLRQAIIAANQQSGLDTIDFQIPQSDSGYDPDTQTWTIRLQSPLPHISDPAILDGVSVATKKPSITLNGSNAGAGDGLVIDPLGGGSTIKGLILQQFSGSGIVLRGNNNDLTGNYIGTTADGTGPLGNGTYGVDIGNASNNIIGGTTEAARNVISDNGVNVKPDGGAGVFIRGDAAVDNQVEGNYIGTTADGTGPLGNHGDGVLFDNGAGPNIVGGATAAARNVLSANNIGVRIDGGSTGILVQNNYIGTDKDGADELGNRDDGIQVKSHDNLIIGNLLSGNRSLGLVLWTQDSYRNRVEANLIGTDRYGTSPLPNQDGGLGVESGAYDNTIGGDTEEARNLISGNQGDGLIIAYQWGPSPTRNHVEGNFIGVNKDGTGPLPNSGNGVRLTGTSDNWIGGEDTGDGNVIAYNGGDGVAVTTDSSPTTGNRILGDLIYFNAGLGIDLGNDGPTPNNTPGPGPNNFQNYPVLASASSSTSGTTVTGSLNSTPSTTFRIEFFSNPVPASGQQAQGQTYLGSVEVTTNSSGSGFASFSFQTTTQVAPGQVITATATNLTTGDTSEFSPASSVGVTTGLAVADASGTYGGMTTLRATLTADRVGVAGQTVAFTLNGTSVGSAMTDGSGVATLQDVGLAGINAGTYSNAVGASFAPGDGLEGSRATGDLVVHKATPTITWSDPAAIASGTPLGSEQLDATASVPGQFVYIPPAGTILAPGPGQVLTVEFTPDDSANYTTATQSVHINVQAELPPRVQGVVINDGSAERSMVTRLAVTFDRLVTIDPGAFEVSKHGGGSVGLKVASSEVNGKTVAVITFTGSDIIGGSLADGLYTLTVHDDKIHDRLGQALDGDANGTAGGDYVDAAIERLFGDADGDGDVDNSDAFSFKAAYRKSSGQEGYRPFFDFNGDGTIDIIDFAGIKKRYGKRI